MTAFKAGMVAVAIQLVVTGIGSGIAQAGGPRSEGPVLSFEDMGVLEQGSSSSSYADNRPVFSFEDQGSSQVAKSPTEDIQLRGHIETGGLPVGSNSGSATGEDGGVLYRYEGKLYGPP